MGIEKFISEFSDPLRPYGDLDPSLLYSFAASYCVDFLRGKELAAKNWIPQMKFPLLKRGSKEAPLFVEVLAENVDENFLKLRKKHLKEVRSKLSPQQQLIWEYFLPRKFSEFLYATNNEGVDKKIDRIFFDIDRGKGVTSEQARIAALEFVHAIEEDGEFKSKLLPLFSSFLIAWTGSSFHVFLMLKEKQDNLFYEKYFKYSKESPETSFTGRWAKKVAEKTKLNVRGGHERAENAINIDPSQTPSGKLCRVPLGSLHVSSPKEYNGISMPLSLKMLEQEDIVEKLQNYTILKFIKDINNISKHLRNMERFR